MRQSVIVSIWVVSLLLGKATTGSCYEAVAVADGGTLTGVVQFRGTRPQQEVLEISKDQNVCGKTEKINESLIVGEDFGVQNAVVSLTNIERGKAFSAKNVTIDQRECRYAPHVLLVPVGGEVSILNNDGILHNIHTHSSTNSPINKPQPKFKKVMKETFQYPEVVKITCDAHAWMSGWLIVTEHPYYAVTDAHGRFQLENIPPGEYEAKVWHESLVAKTQPLLISPRSMTTFNLELMKP